MGKSILRCALSIYSISLSTKRNGLIDIISNFIFLNWNGFDKERNRRDIFHVLFETSSWQNLGITTRYNNNNLNSSFCFYFSARRTGRSVPTIEQRVLQYTLNLKYEIFLFLVIYFFTDFTVKEKNIFRFWFSNSLGQALMDGGGSNPENGEK